MIILEKEETKPEHKVILTYFDSSLHFILMPYKAATRRHVHGKQVFQCTIVDKSVVDHEASALWLNSCYLTEVRKICQKEIILFKINKKVNKISQRDIDSHVYFFALF